MLVTIRYCVRSSALLVARNIRSKDPPTTERLWRDHWGQRGEGGEGGAKESLRLNAGETREHDTRKVVMSAR